MNNLYLKDNYTNKDLKYIKNTIITEYDMESAGMNILTELGYFSEDDRKKLMEMDKLKRNVLIGNLLRRNPKMNEDLHHGFAEARRIFFEKNNIDEYDVLSIKKDAIFLIGNKIIDPNISKYIKIRPKHRYTSYINIMDRENYYNSDTDTMDVKNYGSIAKEHHKDYLLKDLKEVLRNSEKGQVKDNFIKLAVLKDKLISYNLPKGYYLDILREQYLIEGSEFRTNLALQNIEDEAVQDKVLLYNNNLKFILEIIEQVM